jgi:hypothetical protein
MDDVTPVNAVQTKASWRQTSTSECCNLNDARKTGKWYNFYSFTKAKRHQRMTCCTLAWRRDGNEHQASAITKSPTPWMLQLQQNHKRERASVISVTGLRQWQIGKVGYFSDYAYRLQLKIIVPWDVTPGRLIFTDGSEDSVVSIFRVVQEDCF